MNEVFLLLGGNIGDREKNIHEAEMLIQKSVGNINKRSALYNTAAWGFSDQPDFLNRVIIVHTKHDAKDTLDILLDCEHQLGRERSKKNAPRLIDIDILFFNNEIINTKSVTVPHPQIQNRKFVLEPLNELNPLFIHPLLNKTVSQLLDECKDPLNVQKI